MIYFKNLFLLFIVVILLVWCNISAPNNAMQENYLDLSKHGSSLLKIKNNIVLPVSGGKVLNDNPLGF